MTLTSVVRKTKKEKKIFHFYCRWSSFNQTHLPAIRLCWSVEQKCAMRWDWIMRICFTHSNQVMQSPDCVFRIWWMWLHSVFARTSSDRFIEMKNNIVIVNFIAYSAPKPTQTRWSFCCNRNLLSTSAINLVQNKCFIPLIIPVVFPIHDRRDSNHWIWTFFTH